MDLIEIYILDVGKLQMRGNTISLFLSKFSDMAEEARFEERTRCEKRVKHNVGSKSFHFSYIEVLHVSCTQSRLAIESTLMHNITRLIA
jgi:hypothetical protein